MGFSQCSLEICNKICSQLKDAAVLTLGNPFLTNEILYKSNFSKEIKNQIISLDRNIRSSYLFKEVYKVDKFDILDISQDEGAEYIHDLNDLISDKLIINKYDYLLDFGTQEHIFNNNNFLSNVFNLLKDNGKYIFELPANACLEHGFRQYSPTFFYDLCYANRHFLSIDYLGLHNENFILSVLPLYQKLDKNSSKIINSNSNDLNSFGVNNGSLTGTSVALMNNLTSQLSVLGIIQKNGSKELNFKVTQCLYRNCSLEEVIVKQKDKKNFSVDLKLMAKFLILNFPLPASIKIKLISLILKYKTNIKV